MDTTEAIKKRMGQLKAGVDAGVKRLKDLAVESEKMRQQILILKGGYAELETLLQGVNAGGVAEESADCEG